MADAGCKYCVMEVSSKGLKDDRVYGIPFSIGVFTNLSEDHIGGVEHKDMDEYLSCKAKLFTMCPIGVVNTDDPSTEKLLEASTCRVYRYGLNGTGNLHGEGCCHLSQPGLLGVQFLVSGDLDFAVSVGIPGRFNAYNALAAIACCHQLDIPISAMQEGLLSVRVKGRV